MLEQYYQMAKTRREMGIPPLPLDPEQTRAVCDALRAGNAADPDELIRLLSERVAPGVDPAAEVKADFLGSVACGAVRSPHLSRPRAVERLGTMLGGYNVSRLIPLLDDKELGEKAVDALRHTIFVFENFDRINERANEGSSNARAVIESWAAAEWFTRTSPLPEVIRCVVYRVDGEINTDDLSPASHATTRPDIPLHALSMGESRFPDGVEKIAALRKTGDLVAFVGDVVGTGSSRKSACNSLIWHIGEDIPFIPNKRRGGVILGGSIAPIFFNTAEDSGALPIETNVDDLATDMVIEIRPREGLILNEKGREISKFSLRPSTMADEFRAGGRVPLIIGKQLTARAREALGQGPSDLFVDPPVIRKQGVGFSLAQKMVGRACGLDGVHPGSACLPAMTSVGSQDTTGPMTADEIKELACLSFQTDLFMQSFCHTAAYPTDVDEVTHKTLPDFITERGGVSLKPGDGVIHSWLNRMILPDTVGTGGDSHTRFPLGISFPAGSGLVAFAGALGAMPLEMPESVLVRFIGERRPGVTLRDVVNAIPWFAIKAGLLTVEKKGKKNIFNGRVLEMEGLPNLHVEQAFELTDATAERSAAAATITLGEETVASFLKSNVTLLTSLLAEDYQDREALQRRVDAMETWLAKPELMTRDDSAEYAATLDVKLDEIPEPICACPNDPDDVKTLTEIAGAKIDEVFIGSCMINIGHFRAAAKILGQADALKTKLWIVPPTRMDRDQLADEGVLEVFERLGARLEVPGCSLCMGNQARVPDGAIVFSTSTRNFDNRMGKDAKVYLGSAELAALTASLGRIPTAEEYNAAFQEHITPNEADIYRYLSFDKIERYAKA